MNSKVGGGRRVTPWGLILGVGLGLGLPLLIHAVYRSATAFPDRVVLATGPEGGRYRVVAAAIGRELEVRYGIRVEYRESGGSRENLRLLQSGEADFGLFQQGSLHAKEGHERGDEVRFVANLYREPLHVLVRRGASSESASWLVGKRVALGQQSSGDYALSTRLLQHLGLSEGDVDAAFLTPAAIRGAFEEGTLDAAFMTMAEGAPVLRDLLGSAGPCELWPVPAHEAFARHEFSLEATHLVAGIYGISPMTPPEDLPTVASSAQLLTRAQVPTRLVEAVAKLVNNRDFLVRNDLRELYESGAEFSTQRPGFPLHDGAEHYHSPQLRPLLDPDFVEATEGIRSFVVSLLVALYLLIRWLRKRKLRREEHVLERYVRGLLEIDRSQMPLDQNEASAEELASLQSMLDQVTELRMDAISEFSVHQISEDRGVDTFLEMCHSLSSKINAKIGRQRLDLALSSPADS